MMRVKRKPMMPTMNTNRPAPGPTFNNSLLAWQARWKSQQATSPTAKATSQVVVQA